MKIRGLLSLFLFGLFGCATPYQGGLLGGGVEASWLSANVLMVTASGNGYTSEQRVIEYTALRAAEETIAAGYRYMVITDSKDTSRTATFYTQESSETTFNAYAVGDSVYGSASTTTTPAYAIPIYKPGQRAMFAVFKELPDGLDPGQYFDSYFTYNSLGPKYIKDFSPVQIQSD